MSDVNKRIEFLKRKRFLTFLAGVLCLIGAYFGFSESFKAHKELMTLDASELDATILE